MRLFKRSQQLPGIDAERGADPEPGAGSQPEGSGPVTLDDRLAGGSPDTNQASAEPMSPTPDHPEPLAVPDLSDMNVGAGDPQAPSHPAAAPLPAPGAGGVAPTAMSGPGTRPDEWGDTSGTAHRAPGHQGGTPAGEAIETDTAGGAARMTTAGPGTRPGLSPGQGATGPAPATGEAPLEGSSQEQEIVHGVRLADADES